MHRSSRVAGPDESHRFLHSPAVAKKRIKAREQARKGASGQRRRAPTERTAAISPGSKLGRQGGSNLNRRRQPGTIHSAAS